MVTCIVRAYDFHSPGHSMEDVQVTIGEETKVTDAKGYCLFKKIKPGIYDIRLFKDGFGCTIYDNKEIKDTPDVQQHSFGIPEEPSLKLSADKTKIKKNETVTIVAQLFNNWYDESDLKQVSFSINGTQTVISDFDIDKEVAIMTLKGSNQGTVKITAHAQFNNVRGESTAYSNLLVIQDGVEE